MVNVGRIVTIERETDGVGGGGVGGDVVPVVSEVVVSSVVVVVSLDGGVVDEDAVVGVAVVAVVLDPALLAVVVGSSSESDVSGPAGSVSVVEDEVDELVDDSSGSSPLVVVLPTSLSAAPEVGPLERSISAMPTTITAVVAASAANSVVLLWLLMLVSPQLPTPY